MGCVCASLRGVCFDLAWDVDVFNPPLEEQGVCRPRLHIAVSPSSSRNHAHLQSQMTWIITLSLSLSLSLFYRPIPTDVGYHKARYDLPPLSRPATLCIHKFCAAVVFPVEKRQQRKHSARINNKKNHRQATRIRVRALVVVCIRQARMSAPRRTGEKGLSFEIRARVYAPPRSSTRTVSRAPRRAGGRRENRRFIAVRGRIPTCTIRARTRRHGRSLQEKKTTC
jgi:hypothetical protein